MGTKYGQRQTKASTNTKNTFLGVYKDVIKARGKESKIWRAVITIEGLPKCIGLYKTEREAAIAVDKWKINHRLPPVNILKRKE